MKKQKIRKNKEFYGETVFNIAAYNCSRVYITSNKRSKRALAQFIAITNYIHNLPETSKEQMNNM